MYVQYVYLFWYIGRPVTVSGTSIAHYYNRLCINSSVLAAASDT